MAIKKNNISKSSATKKDFENGKKIGNNITKLLSYKDFVDDDKNYILLNDDTYADMLQVSGKGLQSLSLKQRDIILNDYLQFLRTYLDDITFFVSLYPVETEIQQKYWIRKYSTAKNELRKEFIQDRIESLQRVHENKSNQEYTLVIFGETLRDLKNNTIKCFAWGGQAMELSYISREKKINKLYQLNNMNISSKEK